jgi:ribonuclease Z
VDAVLDDGRVLRAHEWLLAPRKARTIIVGGDNDDPGLLLDAARTADVLIHEATYTEEVLRKVGPAPMHSSALRVARMAAAAGLPNLVLTHFSPRYQDGEGPLSMAELEAEARGVYDGHLFLARDLERYVVSREGAVTLAS